MSITQNQNTCIRCGCNFAPQGKRNGITYKGAYCKKCHDFWKGQYES